MFWSPQDPLAHGFSAKLQPSYWSQADPEMELLRRQLCQREMDHREQARTRDLRRLRHQQARTRELHRREQQVALAQREQAVRQLKKRARSLAARRIQRWWRAIAAAQADAAARVAQSLERLAQLEATIETLPAVTDDELSKRASGNGKGVSVFEHTLEKLILSADDVPTHGSDAARALRKRIVRTANARLQAFDEQVVAVKAAQTSQAVDAAERAMIDYNDEATVGVSAATAAPAAEVAAETAAEVGAVEWTDEWMAMETEAGPDFAVAATAAAATVADFTATSPIVDEDAVSLSPPPPPQREAQPLSDSALPVPPDKILGIPKTDSTSHEDDPVVDERDPIYGEEDHVNASVATLIDPELTPAVGSEISQDSKTGLDSDSDSNDSFDFVEVHTETPTVVQPVDEEEEPCRCMYSKPPYSLPDDGQLVEMDATVSDDAADAAAAAATAAAATTRLNVLVAKFTDELANIELQMDGQRQASGVRNAARDLQAAIQSVLP